MRNVVLIILYIACFMTMISFLLITIIYKMKE